MNEEPLEPTRTDLLTALGTMEKSCGLREGFLVDLLLQEPSDWSFVVKAHALLESVVCQLLAAHLRHPPLEDVLAEHIDMEQRIKMLKAVGIADETERKMMRQLGTLRNTLVHNVRQTDFKFEEHFRNKDNCRNFADAFGRYWPDPIPGTAPPISRADFVMRNPRFAVWASIMGIAGRTVGAKLEAQRQELLSALAEAARERTS